jgi:hypothetical protein
MSTRAFVAASGIAAVLAAACHGSGQTAAAGSPPQPPATSAPASPSPSGSPLPSTDLPYQPQIDPSQFSATVDNPWFPLKPGTTFVYEGVKDGKPSRDVYTVTSWVKTIIGVPCVVVHDTLYLAGKVGEETFDYYAQDAQGNVWYFGEDTEELDANGKVTSTEGTWHSGVDGAAPGVYITADPIVGRAFRQEYYKGQAEDQFRATDTSASITVPFGSFDDALMTEEWTTLEPDVLDHKFYVKGIGEVAELSAKGPKETGRLVSVTTK